MEINYFQSSVLAVLQGLTEFLPVSSSAHLLLPSQLLGWPDQGLAFDVMVHLGTLLAVISYFRVDLLRLSRAWISSWPDLWSSGWRSGGAVDATANRQLEPDAVLAWCLLLATVPAGIVGVPGQELLSTYARNSTVIAVTSMVFGLLLLLADSLGSRTRALGAIGWHSALLIGLAQCLALIPGTSRSGVTMSAALLLGFTRAAAARFALLLAVPVIVAGSALQIGVLINQQIDLGQWLQMGTAMLLSAATAFAGIHFFLRLVDRIGLLPFVVYRLLLGALLLGMAMW